jgi:hypothetical protein
VTAKGFSMSFRVSAKDSFSVKDNAETSVMNSLSEKIIEKAQFAKELYTVLSSSLG